MNPTSPHSSFLTQVSTSAARSVGIADGFTVDGVVMSIADDVPVDKIGDAVVGLINFNSKQLTQMALIRWNIGRAVMEMAARARTTDVDVIEDFKLCERTGLSPKTLYNWTSIARRTPPSMMLPGVTWSHLTAIADVKLPDDPGKVLELRKEQQRVLEEVSANPQELGSRHVKQEMGKVLVDLGIKEAKGPSGNEILLQYAILLRKLRYVEETGCEWGAVGEKDRSDVVNKLADYEASLVNLEILSATVEVASDNIDPTPWCSICGAKEAKSCNCPPTAENE